MRLEMRDKTKAPIIIYSLKAFKKLLTMLKSAHAQSNEFLFLGLVTKDENKYNIVDFLLPPQNTSQAYCETNDKEYPKWLAENVPLELRKNIRLHGHSHVNMNTNPSGTDDKMLNDLIENVSDFYIQLIVNHKLQNTVNIFDKKSGINYYNVDQIININEGLISLGKDSSELSTHISACRKKITVEENSIRLTEHIKYNLISKTFIIKIDNLYFYTDNDRLNKLQIILDKEEQEEINKQFNKLVKGTFIYNNNLLNDRWEGDYDDFNKTYRLF